jgi:hypothetical protein
MSSNRSDHEPCVGPTSARLTLAFCALVEHVAQDIVVAVFVHVMDAHMSVTSQLLGHISHDPTIFYIPL